MSAGRFRTRPEFVEAACFDGVDAVGRAIINDAIKRPAWLVWAMVLHDTRGPVAGAAWLEPDYPVPALFVVGRRGPAKAEPGDWIVRHEDGVLDVMRAARFADLFEPVLEV